MRSEDKASLATLAPLLRALDPRDPDPTRGASSAITIAGAATAARSPAPSGIPISANTRTLVTTDSQPPG